MQVSGVYVSSKDFLRHHRMGSGNSKADSREGMINTMINLILSYHKWYIKSRWHLQWEILSTLILIKILPVNILIHAF